jgi:phospholipase/carboxylesterase
MDPGTRRKDSISPRVWSDRWRSAILEAVRARSSAPIALVLGILMAPGSPIARATIDRGTGAPGEARDTGEPPRRLERGARIGSLSYEVRLPADLSRRASFPLLILIHNTGTASQYMDQIEKSLAGLDWIVVCTNDIHVSQKGDVILRVMENTLADIEEKFPVDPDRRYLGGFSAGAMASYLVAFFRPGTFRGVLADGGLIHGGMTSLRAVRRMKLEEVVILSGTRDATITPRELRQNRSLVRSAGTHVRFLTFEGDHVIAPGKLYRAALQWLEGKRRPPRDSPE